LGAPEEHHQGAIETLREDVGVEYSDLICLFASQDNFIFVNRDRSDMLIYLLRVGLQLLHHRPKKIGWRHCLHWIQ